MIPLQKMNGERFLLNHNQIEHIELIPESKIVMMNHDYYIVQDSVEDIIRKIMDYNAKIWTFTGKSRWKRRGDKLAKRQEEGNLT